MAEILDDIKETELQLEEGESAGNIMEDNLDEAHHDIADEGTVVPEASKNSVMHCDMCGSPMKRESRGWACYEGHMNFIPTEQEWRYDSRDQTVSAGPIQSDSAPTPVHNLRVPGDKH